MPPAPQGFDPSSLSLPFEFARVPHRSSTNILNFCVQATNFEVNFPMSASRGMSLYLNLGHALDHLLMLVFPTVLVAGRDDVGRVLGVNGVFGNVGVAFSALIAGALADTVGWRAAFIVPGAIALAVGAAFAFFAREAPGGTPTRRTGPYRIPRADLARVFAVLTVATACGGVIFNATTISMPKVFEERLSALTHSTFGVGMLVCGVYLLAAMAQLCVGWWLDRRSLKAVFVPVVALQVPLLLLAGTTENYLMLATAVAMMFFVFGQIPINDAMIARYTAEEWRARAYAVRYVVSFGASALAVPLVAWVYKSSGDFKLLYYVLGTLAFVIFTAALLFPAEEEKAAAKEMAEIGRAHV